MSPAALPPWPLEAGEAHVALVRLESGHGWREAFEALLLALAPLAAERLMQLVREGRGAFLPLVDEPPGGGAPRALLVGNALSGTAVALARAGYGLTVLDGAPERLALARWRDRHLGRGDATFVLGGGRVLPFAKGAFDLVVQEGGERPAGFAHALAELARVSRGDVLVVADNRLAYKRSSGVRADFRVPGPAAWLRSALRPARGERTLAGYRTALGRALLGRTEAFALYPHAADFSHVVALDAPWPRLTVGPKERANRVKLLAERAGLFPLLAPSFALLARTRGAHERRPRVARWLEEIAGATGEPLPRVENLVATRGNTALLLTAVPGADAADPSGRWALHVALSPQQEVQARRHLARLAELRRRFPDVPVPEPLFEGTVDGVHLTAERRLGGSSAAQSSGGLAAAERTYADVDRHLAALAGPRVTFDDATFERIVAPKFERVAKRAGRVETARAIEGLFAEARTRLVGLEFPLVLQHADLRAKHIQVDANGAVLGYLDWGSSEDEDLPLFDLANLVLHDRKQQAGSSAAEAWALLVDGGLRPFEAAALAGHAAHLDLPTEYAAALVRIHPVLVAAMAEKNWDYSRPRWVHHNFGL